MKNTRNPRLTLNVASMKVPPKRKGNLRARSLLMPPECLNESPSEKEGKCHPRPDPYPRAFRGLNESPSEKEGKLGAVARVVVDFTGLNESPSEKEGKSFLEGVGVVGFDASMKVPPKRKGNNHRLQLRPQVAKASMKVPPKRKGNNERYFPNGIVPICLNESPSEKEGKYDVLVLVLLREDIASMKVPPKRKGNFCVCAVFGVYVRASMKVPPKRKGNDIIICISGSALCASMKVPPKRKGNRRRRKSGRSHRRPQ